MKLTTNIDISGYQWKPIQNITRVEFDGQGYTISGLTIVKEADGNVPPGLFSRISWRSYVHDLVLANVNINITPKTGQDNYVGALASYVNGSESSTDDYSRIERIGVSGNIVNTSYRGVYNFTGGIVGNASYAYIRQCYNAASVEGYFVGGIVGRTGSNSSNPGVNFDDVPEISDCYNIGKISATSAAYNTLCGGICGEADNVNIFRCFNDGQIVPNTANINNPKYYLGGIVGTCENGWSDSDADTYYDWNTTISDCYNLRTNNISALTVGGIIGGYSSSYRTPEYKNNYYSNTITVKNKEGGTAKSYTYFLVSGNTTFLFDKIWSYTRSGYIITTQNPVWFLPNNGTNPYLQWEFANLTIKRTTGIADVTSPSASWSSGQKSVRVRNQTGVLSQTLTCTINNPSADYAFGGWKYDSENGTPIPNSDKMSTTLSLQRGKSVTVYATTVPRIKLTLNANGGNFVSGAKTVVYAKQGSTSLYEENTCSKGIVGGLESTNSIPTRALYTFDGFWTTSSSSGGTQIIDKNGNLKTVSTYSARSDNTVYARWIGKQFDVNVLFTVQGVDQNELFDTPPGKVGKMTITDSDGTKTFENFSSSPNTTMKYGGSIKMENITPTTSDSSGIVKLSYQYIYLYGYDSEGNETIITSISHTSFNFNSSSYASKISDTFVGINIKIAMVYNTTKVEIVPGVYFNGEFSRTDKNNRCGRIKMTFTTYNKDYTLHKDVVFYLDLSSSSANNSINGFSTKENADNIVGSLQWKTYTFGGESVPLCWEFSAVLVGTEVKVEAMDCAYGRSSNNGSFLSFDSDPPTEIKRPDVTTITKKAENSSADVVFTTWYVKESANKMKYDETTGQYYFESGEYLQDYVTDEAILTRLNAGEGSKSGKFYYNNGKDTIEKDRILLDGTYYVCFDVEADTTFMAGGNLVTLHAGDKAWFKYAPIRWTVKFDERWQYGTINKNFTVVSQKLLCVGSVVLEKDYQKFDSDVSQYGFYNLNYRFLYNNPDKVNNEGYLKGQMRLYQRFANGSNNIVVEESGNQSYDSVRMQFASKADIEEATDDKRAEASDLVSFLLGSNGGCVDYWTRDLHSLGNGKAVSGAGADIVRDLRSVLGIRFSAIMTEGSNMVGF